MSESNPPAGEPPSSQQLKAAFKAFKRRLKVIRLDAESRITRSPVTSGRDSGIVAISPPADFPPAVWEALVHQGRLKRAGHGTFELGES